jgi:hypothetical protein
MYRMLRRVEKKLLLCRPGDLTSITFFILDGLLLYIALQGDIKLQSFEVEEHEVTVERNYPFALAAVIHYHALRHWSFYVGPGIELESHENLYLFKAGTEYSFEITENFEIALNLIYENKEGVYDALTFGIAFNKKLWERK